MRNSWKQQTHAVASSTNSAKRPYANGFGNRHLAPLQLLLVHSAVYGYVAGDYWTAFARRVGVCLDPRQQTVWGQRFRLFARLCGCPIGDENPGLRYVGAILRQAGIPTGCLFDLFDLINQSRLDPALRGKSGLALINAWRQSTANWSGLDQPVCDFLVERPEIASRWIEAVQALLVDQLPKWPLPAPSAKNLSDGEIAHL